MVANKGLFKPNAMPLLLLQDINKAGTQKFRYLLYLYTAAECGKNNLAQSLQKNKGVSPRSSVRKGYRLVRATIVSVFLRCRQAKNQTHGVAYSSLRQ